MARDLERIAQKLRRVLAGGDRIRRVVALSMGHSNETYLLEGLDRVLRTPPSEEGLLPPYDMAYQHAVLAAVGAAPSGPPVPRVFELSTDASVIGDPFFVMERLPGEAFEYVVPRWLGSGDTRLRDRLCSQWIGAVAAIHRMPLETIPGPVMTPREEAEHWLEVARRAEAPVRLVR